MTLKKCTAHFSPHFWGLDNLVNIANGNAYILYTAKPMTKYLERSFIECSEDENTFSLGL